MPAEALRIGLVHRVAAAEALRIGLVHRVAAADAIEDGECGAPARPWLHAGYVGPKPVASQVKKDCLPSSI